MAVRCLPTTTLWLRPLVRYGFTARNILLCSPPHWCRWPNGYAPIRNRLAKLERFEWELERRVEIAQQYLDRLAGHRAIEACRLFGRKTPVFGRSLPCGWPIATLSSATIEKRRRANGDALLCPLHKQPAYAALSVAGSPLVHSGSVAAAVLSLPSILIWATTP